MLTSRNFGLSLRRAISSRNPDLLKSNGGGANAILVRGRDRGAPHGTADLAAGAPPRARRPARAGLGRERARVHAPGRPGRAATRCARSPRSPSRSSSAATSTWAASPSSRACCTSAATTSTTSTPAEYRRRRSRCSTGAGSPITRRCGSPSDPEAAQHQHRPLPRRAGLRQHAEAHRGGVDVEERAHPQQQAVLELGVDDDVDVDRSPRRGDRARSGRCGSRAAGTARRRTSRRSAARRSCSPARRASPPTAAVHGRPARASRRAAPG